MSEKLFYRLYWRPYVLLGVSVLLILISSLAPYILPHVWLDKHIPGYYFYMFKTVSWLVKIGIGIFLLSLIRAVTADYFPVLEKLCTAKGSSIISGYKKTWDRGNQLRPVFDFEIDGQKYSCAVNEAKGRRKKDGDVIQGGFTVGLRRKIMYNPQDPRMFYLPGEEIYSRKAAIVRYILISFLFILEAYIGIFHYILG